MIKLINKVIDRRLINNDTNRFILLSETLMFKFIDEFNLVSGFSIEKKSLTEIKYNYNNIIYEVIHRGFRSNENDPDVELILLDLYLNRVDYDIDNHDHIQEDETIMDEESRCVENLFDELRKIIEDND